MISGGGTGLGAAIAEQLAAEGAQVILTGLRAEPLESVAEQLSAHAIVADMGAHIVDLPTVAFEGLL